MIEYDFNLLKNKQKELRKLNELYDEKFKRIQNDINNLKELSELNFLFLSLDNTFKEIELYRFFNILEREISKRSFYYPYINYKLYITRFNKGSSDVSWDNINKKLLFSTSFCFKDVLIEKKLNKLKSSYKKKILYKEHIVNLYFNLMVKNKLEISFEAFNQFAVSKLDEKSYNEKKQKAKNEYIYRCICDQVIWNFDIESTIEILKKEELLQDEFFDESTINEINCVKALKLLSDDQR